MQLIVVREARRDEAAIEAGLLRYALCAAPLADVIRAGLCLVERCPARSGLGLREQIDGTGPGDSWWAVPQSWQTDLSARLGRMIYHNESGNLDLGAFRDCRSPWILVSNGRFVTHLNCRLLGQVLRDTRADAVAVTASPDLLACREVVRLTQDNEVVGYRRSYADSVSPAPVPADWPHHLFVRREAVESALGGGLLAPFDTVVERCRTRGLDLEGTAVAGSVLDLESEGGILALCELVLGQAVSPDDESMRPVGEESVRSGGSGCQISPQARLVGPVLLGKRVTVEPGAVVVGPSVLCDDSLVRRGALIDASILGVKAEIGPQGVLRHSVAMTPPRSRAQDRVVAAWTNWPLQEHPGDREDHAFRTWPRFSYAGCFKRAADAAVAALVLVLFAPVIPFVALAVKMASPGPAFFRDRRQGLRGRPFDCIKFRTMRVGSDKIQEKLRFVSEVDGPQFKMTDDPRITTVGHFLRETYLDEIPQFFNVLCGQMSVVGPRPSPESENTLCPSWRDARLSVRPGITGLWQVCRTREPLKDFQEWIHYDTQYVRELSPRLDLWICWRTFMRMVGSFIRQF